MKSQEQNQAQILELHSNWCRLQETGSEHFEAERYVKAELDFKEALEIAEKMFREDESDDLTDSKCRLTKSLNNLGALYHVQGKYSMAEELYERCLDIKLQLYGQDHLEVAINLHNLAVLHSATRAFMKAEVLYRRAIEIRESAQGKEHGDLVPVLRNYALMLKKNKRENESLVLEKRAEKIESSKN